ncbi:glycosyltransferase [Xanthomarina sp. GH4-25]|uniref:glycosyltransferase n=1 Tax=Xanthomarina sp. GH4-25 TaxID=3349335 RepID=UPI003877FC2B
MKVSIIMMTYNHEKYIEKSINSVLMQETNFDFELIVSNDCSLDSTDKIIKKILKEHPFSKRVIYNCNSKNIGMQPNFVKAFGFNKGEYISLCEGDDYWTDPLKLQKQVDFLDANLDYNICFHSIKVFNEDTQHLESDFITRNVNETTTVVDLAQGNYIHTPSVMLRNNFTLPKWFSKVPIGDWVLYMIAIKDKKIKKLNDVMAVYRSHQEGVWSGKSRLLKLKMTIFTFSTVYNRVPLDTKSKEYLKNEIDKFKTKYKKQRKSAVFFRKVKNKLKACFKL